MKKALKILAVVIPVILLIAYLIIRTPITPPPGYSRADSYDALRALFQDHDDVFVPEEDEIPVQGILYLPDRNRCNPKPYAYLIHKLETDTDCHAEYELKCDTQDKRSVDGTQSYRGVAYSLSYGTTELEKDRSVVLRFSIGGACYDFSARYYGQELSEAEIGETNARVAAQLETYAKQVIDRYRQKNPE